MRFKIYISILFVLSLLACTKDIDTTPAAEAPVTLGFWVGDPQTRTSINSDGITTSWSKDDRVALWADLKIGESFYHRLYNKVEFDLYYRDGSSAMFTTKMREADIMPGDSTTRYRYYATYPVPKSVLENLATFSLPAEQDGKIGNGAAIMVAYTDEAQPLRALKGAAGTSTSNLIKEDHLRLKMKHMMHALKFYVPSTKWGFDEGEKIERIAFTMPQSIAGDVTLDYTNPDFAVTTTKGVKDIELNLTQPIGPSESAANLDFAAASIIPSGHSFVDGDQIVVKMYTQNQAAINYISLKGRTQMRAGHITPIGLDCSDARYQYVLRFVWGGNNLGEDINVIRFYNQDGEQIYEITDVATFVNQRFHDIDFSFLSEDVLHIFTDLAGQPITVEYESDHAIVTDSFKMPEDVIGSGYNEVTLTVPYLFFEDFSGIGNFTDDHDDANIGLNLDGDASNGGNWLDGEDAQLAGWSGYRVGGSAGKSIRIMARYEGGAGQDAYYRGRIDTPALKGIKSTAKIKIEFDYSSAYKYYFTRKGELNTPTKFYMGYTTTEGAIKSNEDLSYTLISKNLTNENGSYDYGFVSQDPITIDSATAKTRLSWMVNTDIRANFWGGNGNFWVYLDNIKVQIAK
jgi:hypothetical protein